MPSRSFLAKVGLCIDGKRKRWSNGKKKMKKRAEKQAKAQAAEEAKRAADNRSEREYWDEGPSDVSGHGGKK